MRRNCIVAWTRVVGKGERAHTLHDAQPMRQVNQHMSLVQTRGGGWQERDSRRTWVASLAIGTNVVARNTVNEVLEDLLIARLLALVERTVVHGDGDVVARAGS